MRILIADDHTLFRDGLRSLLQVEGHEVIGEARSQIARAHGEATSLIERARGEAEANRLRQASITPQLLEWRCLENQRALVERWNGDLPKTVLGEKSNLLLPFQTEQK